MLKIYDISVNSVCDPELILTRGLKFAWKLKSDINNTYQTSYKVEILTGNDVYFDSGVIWSSKSFDIGFNDLVLPSRTDVQIKVTAWDNYMNSATATISTATEILPDEWGDAVWIKPASHIVSWAPYLRTKFVTNGKIKKAVMYASGLGCAEYYVNGKRTDDHYIEPPFTNYEKTVYYRRYDLTDLLVEGGNALTILLGEGFYSQSCVWGYLGLSYGDVCAKVFLEITLKNGEKQIITTNTTDWKFVYSPITLNNIYEGEAYDCRLEVPGFADYDGSDARWHPVIEDKTPKGVLTPALFPPVRVVREVETKNVRAVSGTKDGAWIFDLGENIAGTVEFHLPQAPRGCVYVFRYAETLDEGGALDMRSVGSMATQCIQQDIYICRGDVGGEVYTPRLTYHGFRYVEITGFYDLTNGYGTVPWPSIVKGLALSNDFRKDSKFTCSNEYLNRLMDVMDNTYRSNWHGFPEDCPVREKCGWLGDAQLVSDYGLLTFDTAAAYVKYLNDIRTSKEVYGTWPQIAPGKRLCGDATPLWGCAQIVIPYNLYKYTGNSSAVIDNFDLMKEWFQHELDRSEDYIIYQGLGDWHPPVGNKDPRRMPVEHSGTIQLYENAKMMEELCRDLGLGDPEYYAEIAKYVKEAFNRTFFNKENYTYGYWGSDGAALKSGIYPDDLYREILFSIADRIENDEFQMQTGIYGNKYLVPALIEGGYGDIAMSYLFNKDYPSFATMLDDGATTVWEDISMHSAMPKNLPVSSYNHPMHGAFLYICYTHIAGIKPIKPGFSEFEFSPIVIDSIRNFEVSLSTVSGKIKVSRKGNEFKRKYRLSVPANTTCVVTIPNCKITDAGGEEITERRLGSGKYIVVVGE